MSNLLLSLGAGIALILTTFLTLNRWTPLGGKRIGVLLSLLVPGVYVPIAILRAPGLDVIAIHLAIYLLTIYVLTLVSLPPGPAGVGGAGRRRWHWGPIAIIGFFVVVILTDVAFVTLAETGLSQRVTQWLLPQPPGGGVVQSAFPGVVSHDYQEREQYFNAYLEQRARQREQGWQVRKGWLADPVAGTEVVFQVQVADRAGQSLTGATVEGRFLRPADSRQDLPFTMQEVASGTYQAKLVLPRPGAWDLVLDIRHAQGLHEVRASTSVVTAAAAAG